MGTIAKIGFEQLQLIVVQVEELQARHVTEQILCVNNLYPIVWQIDECYLGEFGENCKWDRLDVVAGQQQFPQVGHFGKDFRLERGDVIIGCIQFGQPRRYLVEDQFSEWVLGQVQILQGRESGNDPPGSFSSPGIVKVQRSNTLITVQCEDINGHMIDNAALFVIFKLTFTHVSN